MAAKRGELVPRPPKKIEYEIRYATTDAANYPLRGELGTITRGDTTHERWQHKPTLKGTARIWFFVEERTVYLEQVHTSHPNETK